MMNSAKSWLPKAFTVSISCVLWSVGLAKLISAFGPEGILLMEDPILPMRYRSLFILAALIELTVAAYLTIGSDLIKKYLLINALGLGFLLYRGGLMLLKPVHHCPCLGTLGSHIPVDPLTQQRFLFVVAVGMFLGSTAALVMRLRESNQARVLSR